MTDKSYLHGSSSVILIQMQVTGVRLMDPIAMIETYSQAPMVGELGNGLIGYKNKGCAPCFAQLQNRRYLNPIDHSYSVAQVKGYAENAAKSSTYNYTDDEIGCITKDLNRINEFLVYCERNQLLTLETN